MNRVRDHLRALSKGAEATESLVFESISDILDDNATAAQTGALLALLAARPLTVDIISGCRLALRDHAIAVPVIGTAEAPVVDIVGTGGDGHDTINVSTTAGIVAAACGLRVAKHGNRAASSACGSADVLEHLGARLMLSPSEAKHVVETANYCFLFAPAYLPCLKPVAAIRLELGIRTVFNVIGPLVNPATPQFCVVGVYTSSLGPLMATALIRAGVERGMVVCGAEQLDEISIAGDTHVWSFDVRQHGDTVTASTLSPADFGIDASPLSSVAGGDREENAATLRAILTGTERGPKRDFVLLNAAALLVVAGKAESYEGAVGLARAAIDDGRAATVLEQYIRLSNQRES